MRVGVLGATLLWPGDQDDPETGAPTELGSRKLRQLLAGLALYAPRPVSVDRCLDLLWGEDPPRGAGNTLQSYVASLRRLVEPGRGARAPATVLTTESSGYALRLARLDLDAARFEDAVTRWRRDLRASESWLPRPIEQPRRAADELGTALAWWRGEPYADLDGADVAAERARLTELRLAAVEDRAAALLLAGDPDAAAADLEAMVHAHPLRERPWLLRSLALYRGGRQAEALAGLQGFRDMLDTELGLEPGPALADLQTAILRQDARLDLPAAETLPVRSASRAGPRRREMVGRQQALQRLRPLLDPLEGAEAFAVITGEPGIGKTRLVEELVSLELAGGQGTAAVAVGGCSQDDGMPPLWPWVQVLAALGEEWPEIDGDDPGAQFRAWAAIVETLQQRARHAPVLIVLEDLHWADASSLRVLRLLAESRAAGGVRVIATWRDAAGEASSPTLLAAVAESLARRHAIRIELSGLDVAATAALVGQVMGQALTSTQARALQQRTEGNPFFLIEFARLGAERPGDLADLLDEPDPPRAIQDVLLRRLSGLPSRTRALLQFAAVVGREFELRLLGAAEGDGGQTPLDDLEPAIRAGLVREQGPDRLAFTHALVRDVLHAGVTLSRRARWHAAIAAAYGDEPRHLSERARHWLAAGPAHAGAAWRAAELAAAQAHRLHAHDEAARLLEAALSAIDDDPRVPAVQRFELLAALVGEYRFTGQWVLLVATVEAAIAEADLLGDVDRLADAATAASVGAFWQSNRYGQTNEVIVSALRRALAALPPGDSARRSRAQLALAHEEYYRTPLAARQALVADAVAGARRLDDDGLLLDCLLLAGAALWARATIVERLALAEEAIELATRAEDGPGLAVARTQQVQILSELGRADDLPAAVRAARSVAERLQMTYALLVIDGVDQSWATLSGDFATAETLLARMAAAAERLDLPQGREAVGSAIASLRLWQGRAGELGEVMAGLRSGPLPLDAVAIMIQLRAGQLDAARSALAETTLSWPPDSWMAPLVWCANAEIAAWLGLPEVGATALPLLEPLLGQCASAGSGGHQGPVDSFAALAAYAAGDVAQATRHAERAATLIEEWRLPPVRAWWQAHRSRFGI